jgi:hypothetical protein
VLCPAELHKRALQSERTAADVFAEKSMWKQGNTEEYVSAGRNIPNYSSSVTLVLATIGDFFCR